MSICGLSINIESIRSEFFLSVIVFELKYPRRRSFHQIYFPLVNKNRLLKRWLDTVRNCQPSRKKCFYRYHTKGFRATKFRNLLELTRTIQKFLKLTRERESIKNNPKSGGVTYSFFPLLIFPPGKMSIY
jgi:hypothetical protein